MPSIAGSGTSHSLSTIANVHVINDPVTLPQFDAVTISFELFIRLFPHLLSAVEDESKTQFVLIKFLGVPDYFREFKIFKIASIDHNAPTPNSVSFKNHSNLTKFDDRITFNKCVIQSIDTESIPVLSEVFVSVPPSIYDILFNVPADILRHRFINTYLSNGAVVTNGDTVRLINGEIKLCEPVPQGKVDETTNIVLVKQTENEPIEVEEIFEEEEVNEDIDLSSYLSTSLQFDFLDEAEEAASPAFKVRPLPTQISIDSLPPTWALEDTELFVFINTHDLPRMKFPLFNGDMVLLQSINEDGLKSKVIVKLFTLLEPNKYFASGTVYLSPHLLINLHLNSESTVFIEPLGAESKLKSSNNQFLDLIPKAKSATLCRVASSITMDRTFQQSFLNALKTRFNTAHRCVRKGDLIPVVLDSVLAKTMFDVNNSMASSEENDGDLKNEAFIPSGDPDSVAWFKIVDLVGPESASEQFIIDPSETALTSSGLDFTRQPPNEFSNWYQYLNLPPLFNYNKVLSSDPDTFKYASELKRILNTCMLNPIKLKTSILLNSMSRGLGKTTLVRNLVLELGLNSIELDCFDLINPGAELKTVGLLSAKIEKLINDQPSEVDQKGSFHVIYLKHIENLCVQTNQNEQGANMSTSLSLKIVQTINDYLDKYANIVVIMSCNDIDKLNDSVRLMVKFQIDLGVPSEQERLEIFKFLISNETQPKGKEDLPEMFEDRKEFVNSIDISKLNFGKRQDVSFSSLALQSAGLTPRDLISIVNKAKQLSIRRFVELSSKLNISIEKLIKVGNGGLVTWIPEDFNKAINDARNQFSDSIGAPRIPNVKWEDIGGLDVVKGEILDTIDMPLKHPELFNNGLKKRSGILFYGPPGTGKTLLAKAIASNFSLNFFSVKGPELLNMYIGESEANVRRVFQKARDAKPCVIFFDELDSVAPKRGNQGDSGGVMDRIVSQLLAELDGMSGGDNGDGVFVVGATNRPDLLDEALLRPGRFDKMLYLGISDTDEKQTKILEALTRKFKLADDVDLAKVAKNCSFTFTGADFYALCSDSMLNAMTRSANEVDIKIKDYNAKLELEGKSPVSTRWWFDNEATEDDTEVFVKMEDFVKSQNDLTPSVSAEELEHYLRIRENFEGGKEKAMQSNGKEKVLQSNGIDGSQLIQDAINALNGDVNGNYDHVNGNEQS